MQTPCMEYDRRLAFSKKVREPSVTDAVLPLSVPMRLVICPVWKPCGFDPTGTASSALGRIRRFDSCVLRRFRHAALGGNSNRRAEAFPVWVSTVLVAARWLVLWPVLNS
jgi:hypothetical protein